MSGTQPVAVYAMKVPCGDVMVPAVPDFAAMFRLSMAAIDPSAEPEFEVGDEKKQPRATLKIVRVPGELLDDESDESDLDELEDDEDEDEESSDGEEANGGPSDPSKAKKPSKLDLVKAIAEADSEDEDEDESDDLEEEAAAKDALMKILKGKAKATGDGDKDDEEDDDFDGLELEEIVVCTLDPEKVIGDCPTTAQDLRLTLPSITSNLLTLWLVRMRRYSSRSPAHTRCTSPATMSFQLMMVKLNSMETMMRMTTIFPQMRTNSML